MTPDPNQSGLPSILLDHYAHLAENALTPKREGVLTKAIGLVLEARGCEASIGDLYGLRNRMTQSEIPAEAVGLRDDATLLMPLGETHGLEIGASVRRLGRAAQVPVSDQLLGRVLNGLGQPIDGRPAPAAAQEYPLHGTPRNPLDRKPVDKPFWVGVRAIDGVLTMGRGQRMGIFSGGGVGKSSLLAMMVKQAEADVCVIGLVGERGREVEEFVHHTLGTDGLARSVVVAATSSDPPLVRARGALHATAIAEYFRDQGKHVLLLMDSVTRYAMALREVGLATGEPPTTRGYTPSVFAALPQLLERAGTCAGEGSITAVYTVLVEGDDMSDPISDALRAILDGHIVLSRNLAERGHFPAIDVPQSVSRVMPRIATGEHMQAAQNARRLLATYREVEDLIAIGAYSQGTSPHLDEAVNAFPQLESFMQQSTEDNVDPENTLQALITLGAPTP